MTNFGFIFHSTTIVVLISRGYMYLSAANIFVRSKLPKFVTKLHFAGVFSLHGQARR